MNKDYIDDNEDWKPAFVCDGCYYIDGKKEDFNIDLSDCKTIDGAKDVIVEVLHDDFYDDIRMYEDFSLAFNVRNGDGEFLFSGGFNDASPVFPEWFNDEINFFDSDYGFKHMDEGKVNDRLIELMEDPNTVWVGTTKGSSEDPYEASTVAKMMSYPEVVNDVEAEIVEQLDDDLYAIEYKFKVSDPYKFNDFFGIFPYEVAEPEVDMNESIDESIFDGISTNKRDWRVVNESELDVYDKPSYMMTFNDRDEANEWEMELKKSNSVSGVYGTNTPRGYLIGFELEDLEMFKDEFGVDVNDIANYVDTSID